MTRDLKWLVDTYEVAQRYRIAFGNRIEAATRENASHSNIEFYRTLYQQFHDIEQEIAKAIEQAVESHPVWPWLSEVRGIGRLLAGRLIGLVGSNEDMEKRNTPSQLVAFAGLAPGRHLVKGQKSPYNRRLKTLLYVIGVSFLRAQSQFVRFYYDAKERYQKTHPEWTKAHVHLAAMRRMNKIFLCCLWQVWREALGLPIRQPYAVEYLGHSTVINPWEVVREKTAGRRDNARVERHANV